MRAVAREGATHDGVAAAGSLHRRGQFARPRRRAHSSPQDSPGAVGQSADALTCPSCPATDMGRAFAIAATVDGRALRPFEAITIVGREQPTAREVFTHIAAVAGVPKPAYSVPLRAAYGFGALMEAIHPIHSRDARHSSRARSCSSARTGRWTTPRPGACSDTAAPTTGARSSAAGRRTARRGLRLAGTRAGIAPPAEGSRRWRFYRRAIDSMSSSELGDHLCRHGRARPADRLQVVGGGGTARRRLARRGRHRRLERRLRRPPRGELDVGRGETLGRVHQRVQVHRPTEAAGTNRSQIDGPGIGVGQARWE